MNRNFEKILRSSLRPLFQSLVYFPNLVLLGGLQNKSQSSYKESFKEDPKTFMKFGFQTAVSKFQFKVSFSTSKFPIRVLKLGAGLNRFYSNPKQAGLLAIWYDWG